MRNNIIAALLFATLLALIFSAGDNSPAFANSDGGDGVHVKPVGEDLAHPTPRKSIAGVSILVVGDSARPFHGQDARDRLASMGASATYVDQTTLTAGMLDSYDVVWIALWASTTVYNAGHTNAIRGYVNDGGGLLLEQPNQAGPVGILPYSFVILDHFYEGECETDVLVPTHEIVVGLSNEQLLECQDTVGSIGPEWQVLVEDGTGDPSLSVAAYGAGRIVVELGSTDTQNGCWCITGSGDVCMSDIMIERMVEWVVKEGLSRINLSSPADASTQSSPPTFTWNPNGGGDNRYVVDFHIPGLLPLGTTPILSQANWTMPSHIWNFLSSGTQVYWRVRGADLDVTPLDIVISDEIWSLNKQ